MMVLGLLAGVLTTVSFLPQVLRTLRTGSAGDLSWGWLLLFGTGVTGWLAYGVARGDVAITATNAVTLALIGLIAGMKAWQQNAARTLEEHP